MIYLFKLQVGYLTNTKLKNSNRDVTFRKFMIDVDKVIYQKNVLKLKMT